jgi:predicted nucleic acid-binding protein
MAYILDSDLFTRTLRGELPATIFRSQQMLATAAQALLLREHCSAAMISNLPAFREVGAVQVEQFEIDEDGFGGAWLESGVTAAMLDERLSAKGGVRKASKRFPDILVAETAINHRATLISDDRHLRATTEEFGGSAVSFSDFSAARR